MAVYKTVDSDALDKNLKNIADSIREKGGTSAKLTFPEGFTSAINGIETFSDVLDSIINGSITELDNSTAARLGQYAFAYSENLRRVNLTGVKYSNTAAFTNCFALETLLLPNLVGYTYQYMAAYCENLREVDIRQASYISNHTFHQCISLTSLDLHKAGTIASNAFNGATNLETLILRMDSVPSLTSANAFTDTKIEAGQGYIYVPAALIESYKTASNWSSFRTRFRALENYTVDGTVTGDLDTDRI